VVAVQEKVSVPVYPALSVICWLPIRLRWSKRLLLWFQFLCLGWLLVGYGYWLFSGITVLLGVTLVTAMSWTGDPEPTCRTASR